MSDHGEISPGLLKGPGAWQVISGCGDLLIGIGGTLIHPLVLSGLIYKQFLGRKTSSLGILTLFNTLRTIYHIMWDAATGPAWARGPKFVPLKVWLPIVAFSITLVTMIGLVLYLQTKRSIEQNTALESLPSRISSDNLESSASLPQYAPPPYEAGDRGLPAAHYDISLPKPPGIGNVMITSSDAH